MTSKTNTTDQSTILQLKAMGVSDEVIPTPRRLIASVSGGAKQGKTHFCLTAPAPIIFFNIDLGTEGVVGKFQEGTPELTAKQVLVYNIRVPKGESKDVYERMWNELKQRMEKAYELHSGTVVVDTSSEAYELCRLAYFGKLTQVMPHHYQIVNNDWREFMRMAYDSPMNTLLIHKVKPKYVNNVRTTEYEIAGMSEIPYLVQTNLTMFREDMDEGSVFGLTVADCRQNSTLAGMVLRGYPMNSFDFLLNLVHGEEK
jgi:hypothetical protein